MSLEDALILEPGSSFEPQIQELRDRAGTVLPVSGNIAPAPVGQVQGRSHAALPESAFDEIEATAVSWPRRFFDAFAGGSVFRKSAIALIDQGVVSAVNFLTMVLLRRTIGGGIEAAEHQLGLYQLGFSVVLLATCIQNALISTPYAVFGNRLRGQERKRYAGSTLIHQGLLSGLASFLLLIVGVVLASWSAGSFDGVAFILAAMLPFILAREFVRRLAFVHLQVVTVLLLDMFVAVLQLGGLWALKSTGHLTAASTFCVIGLACAIAGLGALFLLRGHFAVRQTKSWSDFWLSWSFGKWALAAQIVYLVMVYSPSWMLAIFSGAAATGRFAVSWSLIMVANPLLIGLYNYLGPQAIYAYHADGLAALRRLTIRIGLVMTLVVSVLYGLLLLFGGTLLVVFFGAKLHGQEDVVSILAFSMVLQAMSISAENGLTALNRPTTIFLANTAGLFVSGIAGRCLIGMYGVIGAAWAALIGAVVVTAIKIFWFYRASRDSMAVA